MNYISFSLKTNCNIGITEQERSEKQPINITIKMYTENINTDNIENVLDYDKVHSSIKQLAENSRFNLIETLAKNLADSINHPTLKKLEITINKPKAIEGADVSFTHIKQC